MSNDILILASTSPRRRDLLSEMGVAFEIATADVREHDAESSPHLAPLELACENARQKALAVAKAKPSRWILGADTVVALGEKLYGKPASREQAEKFLRELSGHTHEVFTGCALVAPDGEAEIFHDITRVTFRELNPALIARYLAAVNVLDKAGAYALQEHGGWIVADVKGSRSNVIGLPTEVLEKVLRRRGLLST